jgi:membrane-associated phospholipid phosphatase
VVPETPPVPTDPTAPADPTSPAAIPAHKPIGPIAPNGEPITQELNPFVPWYRGKYGHNRIVHLSATAAMAAVYLASETVLKSTFAAKTCRWCNPPGFDRSVRDSLVWGNSSRADLISSLDAYVLAPLVGLTLLVASESEASWSRFIDDTVPVAETVAVAELVTQAIKFTVGRQRPYAHFGDPNAPHGVDDNTSFSSGHSALGFSLTVSVGIICHWRGYWTEPYVWASGIALSLSVEYLRMAADKHYLSDVLVGGFIGAGAGLVIPRLMRRDIKIVPINNGAAVVGSF